MVKWISLLVAVLLLIGSPFALAEGAKPNKNFIIPLPVNINQASAEVLDLSLDGIGAKKAQAIVEYRVANGPFRSVEELAKVKGIGAGTLARNKGRITVD